MWNSDSNQRPSGRSSRLRVLLLGHAALGVSMLPGCMTPPPPAPQMVQAPDTTVYFYPARGQSPDQQGRDKYECNAWAVEQSSFDPSAPTTPPHLRVPVVAGPPPGSGAAQGAVAGAVIGASISRPWESGRGAVLGAIAGALIGSAAESAARSDAEVAAASASQDAYRARLEQQARDFRRAMMACLEGRGYSVR